MLNFNTTIVHRCCRKHFCPPVTQMQHHSWSRCCRRGLDPDNRPCFWDILPSKTCISKLVSQKLDVRKKGGKQQITRNIFFFFFVLMIWFSCWSYFFALQWWLLLLKESFWTQQVWIPWRTRICRKRTWQCFFLGCYICFSWLYGYRNNPWSKRQDKIVDAARGWGDWYWRLLRLTSLKLYALRPTLQAERTVLLQFKMGRTVGF